MRPFSWYSAKLMTERKWRWQAVRTLRLRWRKSIATIARIYGVSTWRIKKTLDATKP